MKSAKTSSHWPLSWRRIVGLSLALTAGGLGVLALSLVQAQAREASGAQARAQLASNAAGESIDAQVERRARRVRAELAAQHGQHAWAGEYYEGDGLGMNMSVLVAPGVGVSATWRGCTGLYAQNEGEVATQADGSLKLNYAHQAKTPFELPTHLRPVRWGERVYLIDASDMAKFVDSINLGDEPRTGAYGFVLLRRGDEKKAVAGLPDLPADQLAAIRSVALKLNVTASKRTSSRNNTEYCTDTYELTLNRGLADGIRPGVELQSVARDRSWERVRIVAAEQETSVAQWTDTDGKCGKDRSAELRRWAFSTGSYPKQ